MSSEAKKNLKLLRDIFKGHTVFVLASGPSLTEEDACVAKQHGKTIVVNTTVKMLPDTDVLFASDYTWWKKNRSLWEPFEGYKVSKHTNRTRREIDDHIMTIPYQQKGGLSKDTLIFGGNSGQGAISLAYIMGASRIVLLGFDMSVKNGIHWHGKHEKSSNPDSRKTDRWKRNILEMYKESNLDVEIINASRYTELNVFPKRKLEEIVK